MSLAAWNGALQRGAVRTFWFHFIIIRLYVIVRFHTFSNLLQLARVISRSISEISSRIPLIIVEFLKRGDPKRDPKWSPPLSRKSVKTIGFLCVFTILASTKGGHFRTPFLWQASFLLARPIKMAFVGGKVSVFIRLYFFI